MRKDVQNFAGASGGWRRTVIGNQSSVIGGEGRGAIKKKRPCKRLQEAAGVLRSVKQAQGAPEWWGRGSGEGHWNDGLVDWCKVLSFLLRTAARRQRPRRMDQITILPYIHEVARRNCVGV